MQLPSYADQRPLWWSPQHYARLLPEGLSRFRLSMTVRRLADPFAPATAAPGGTADAATAATAASSCCGVECVEGGPPTPLELYDTATSWNPVSALLQALRMDYRQLVTMLALRADTLYDAAPSSMHPGLRCRGCVALPLTSHAVPLCAAACCCGSSDRLPSLRAFLSIWDPYTLHVRLACAYSTVPPALAAVPVSYADYLVPSSPSTIGASSPETAALCFSRLVRGPAAEALHALHQGTVVLRRIPRKKEDLVLLFPLRPPIPAAETARDSAEAGSAAPAAPEDATKSEETPSSSGAGSARTDHALPYLYKLCKDLFSTDPLQPEPPLASDTQLALDPSRVPLTSAPGAAATFGELVFLPPGPDQLFTWDDPPLPNSFALAYSGGASVRVLGGGGAGLLGQWTLQAYLALVHRVAELKHNMELLVPLLGVALPRQRWAECASLLALGHSPFLNYASRFPPAFPLVTKRSELVLFEVRVSRTSLGGTLMCIEGQCACALNLASSHAACLVSLLSLSLSLSHSASTRSGTGTAARCLPRTACKPCCCRRSRVARPHNSGGPFATPLPRRPRSNPPQATAVTRLLAMVATLPTLVA